MAPADEGTGGWQSWPREPSGITVALVLSCLSAPDPAVTGYDGSEYNYVGANVEP